MNHGDHGGHGGGGAPPAPACKLHMLWNTQIENTCVVFRSWHVYTKFGFLLSCLAIIALCVFHEYIRVLQKQVDYRVALSLRDKSKLGGIATPGSARRSPSPRGRGSSPEEESGLLSGRRILAGKVKGVPVPTPSRLLRASIYGASVFISFFLMLVFMTYNAYLIASVVIGAAVGHYVFGGTLNPDAVLNEGGQDKGMACH